MPTAKQVPKSVELLQRDFDHGAEVIRQIADMRQIQSSRQPLQQHDIDALERAHEELITAYARFPYKTRIANHQRMRSADRQYRQLHAN